MTQRCPTSSILAPPAWGSCVAISPMAAAPAFHHPREKPVLCRERTPPQPHQRLLKSAVKCPPQLWSHSGGDQHSSLGHPGSSRPPRVPHTAVHWELLHKTPERFSNEVMTYTVAKSNVQVFSLPQICLRFIVPVSKTQHSGVTVVFAAQSFVLPELQKTTGRPGGRVAAGPARTSGPGQGGTSPSAV